MERGGLLPTALSDAAAVTTRRGILVLGGLDGRGQTHDELLAVEAAAQR